jgi:hypothetical protein
MIPALSDTGLLPDGEHPATWSEVVATFGHGVHRSALLGGLLLACHSLAACGCRRLWLDGSFVTRKLVPDDYDACWDPDGVDPDQLDPVLLDWSAAGRLRMKAKYLGDLFIAGAEGASGLPFVHFFQKDRDGAPKGIVVIDPEEAG